MAVLSTVTVFPSPRVALVKSAQAEYSDAVSLLRECLDIRCAALPPDHWLIPNTKGALGEALTELGRYDEASN